MNRSVSEAPKKGRPLSPAAPKAVAFLTFAFLSFVLLAVLLPTEALLAQGLGFAPEEQVQTQNGGSTAGGETGGNEQTDDQPYWIRRTPENQRPYWLPPEGDPLPSAEQSPAENQEDAGFFAPPPPPPPPPPPAPPELVKAAVEAPTKEYVGEVMSYYMFKDDHGVTHLTDAPSDPRFRMFTIQITVTTGLAPYRRVNLDRVRPYILRASATYQVDPALITAIIKSESAFDPQAVSWAGARGLMQLMPNTAKQMGVSDSFDPEQNIMGGTRYIRMMLNRFQGNVRLAVAAYNCGPERVARVMAVPQIRETQNYVKTVLRNYEMFLQIFATEQEN
ncbi:MAG: lytic transglycosylase domain-containing protein [Deltaproteobacteria bacterium]|jgi:soluble lytic murein transglycosylase|nr:lytic transglycosylase domain-containing protein [Deltaproteobacteria bacterium]